MRNATRKALSVNGKSRRSLGVRHMRRAYSRRTRLTPASLSSWRPPPPALLGGFPCSYWKNREVEKGR